MASAGIGLLSLGLNVNQQRKGRKQQRRQERVNARRAEIDNASSRRRSIAEGNRLRAQTVAQGTNQGVGGGSGVAGASGSVISQSAADVGQSQVFEGLDTASFNFASRANSRFNRGRTFQALGDAITPFLNS